MSDIQFYENKDLFYAEFFGTVRNSFFIIKHIYFGSGGLITNSGFIGLKKTPKAVNPEPRIWLPHIKENYKGNPVNLSDVAITQNTYNCNFNYNFILFQLYCDNF